MFMMNLLYFVIVGNLQAFKEKLMYKMILFNETVVFHLTLCLSLFTDYCPKPEHKYFFGWIFIIELVVFLFGNLCMIAWPSLVLLYNYLRSKYIFYRVS